MDKESYFQVLEALKIPEKANWDFLYNCFEYAYESKDSYGKDSPVLNKYPLDPSRLSLYLANEHLFYLSTHPDAKVDNLIEDEKYIHFLVSISVDKYFTNEHLAFKTGKLTTRFSPEISTLDLYLNFILGILSHYKKTSPQETLLTDMLDKGFQIAKCVSLLLEQGYETEAFSSWRTLHENESILTVLLKHGKPVIDAYLKHMRYGMAFRGVIGNKEETDLIFKEIKEGMASFNLKSKDMKKYIEYGWLLAIPDVKLDENVKLNFRNGVEELAGLSSYSKVYEMSSEIAHSSPLLIYSRKNYFFSLTLINLYESFFRLESVFSQVYLSSISKEKQDNYLALRKVYFGEAKTAYEIQKKIFYTLNQEK